MSFLAQFQDQLVQSSRKHKKKKKKKKDKEKEKSTTPPLQKRDEALPPTTNDDELKLPVFGAESKTAAPHEPDIEEVEVVESVDEDHLDAGGRPAIGVRLRIRPDGLEWEEMVGATTGEALVISNMLGVHCGLKGTVASRRRRRLQSQRSTQSGRKRGRRGASASAEQPQTTPTDCVDPRYGPFPAGVGAYKRFYAQMTVGVTVGAVSELLADSDDDLIMIGGDPNTPRPLVKRRRQVDTREAADMLAALNELSEVVASTATPDQPRHGSGLARAVPRAAVELLGSEVPEQPRSPFCRLRVRFEAADGTSSGDSKVEIGWQDPLVAVVSALTNDGWTGVHLFVDGAEVTDERSAVDGALRNGDLVVVRYDTASASPASAPQRVGSARDGFAPVRLCVRVVRNDKHLEDVYVRIGGGDALGLIADKLALVCGYNGVRLSVDGQEVDAKSTPAGLKLASDTTVEASFEEVDDIDVKSEDTPRAENAVQLQVRVSWKRVEGHADARKIDEIPVTIKKDDDLVRIADILSKTNGYGGMRLFIDGERLESGMNADSFDLEDEDIIDADFDTHTLVK